MGDLVAFPRICAYCSYPIRFHPPRHQQIAVVHQGQHYHAECWVHVARKAS